MIDVPYELVHVDYFKGKHKEEPYLSINPNAKLPAMVDGDFTLWESNAILQYAADKADNSDAYPRELHARADVNRWLFWEAATWFPDCYVYLVENCVKPLLGGKPDPAVLDAHAPEFHKSARILDQRLARREWLVGDDPTIADVAMAAPMHLHAWAQLPLDEHPSLMRWMTNNVEKLPCWQKTTVYEGFTTTRPV